MVQDGVEWFGAPCTKIIDVPQPQATPPKINNLHVSNGGNPGGTYQISGKQALTTEGGSGYYNPINIYLETTRGSANPKQYYVSFYDPALYDASLNSPSLMNLLQTRIDKDPTKGFYWLMGLASLWITGQTVPPSSTMFGIPGRMLV